MGASSAVSFGPVPIPSVRPGDVESRVKAPGKRPSESQPFIEARLHLVCPRDAYLPTQRGHRRPQDIAPRGDPAPSPSLPPTGGVPPNPPSWPDYAIGVKAVRRPRAELSGPTDADDPFSAALDAAEFDDEPFTAEDRAAADAGWREYGRGESSSLDEVRRRLLGDEVAGHRVAV